VKNKYSPLTTNTGLTFLFADCRLFVDIVLLCLSVVFIINSYEPEKHAKVLPGVVNATILSLIC
jgi:hypothetical protein